MKPFLLDLDRDQLSTLVNGFGEKPFRAKQLWQWLHSRRVSSCAKMTNLPTGLRARLEQECFLRVLVERRHLVSRDKLTEKWLWQANTERNNVSPGAGREAELVEAVLIREKRLKRATACVSSMIGCPLGCRFCATGMGGFDRSLSCGEIIEQVYRIDACAQPGEKPPRRGLTNVVFMGMGEPLLNYNQVLAAARILTDPDGMGMSGRHITISTIGIPGAIRRLATEAVNFRLAISLHAPTQDLRQELLPATRAWPLDDIMSALQEFARASSRDLTIEYCLINGVNAEHSHARALVRLLAPLPCKVNLIPLNPVPGFSGSPPPPTAIRGFQTVLERGGITVTLRTEKGQDINAACGQLRNTPSGRS